MKKLTETDLGRIHRKVHLLLADETGLIFSGRQAIANDVVLLLRIAREEGGQRFLSQYLTIQEMSHL